MSATDDPAVVSLHPPADGRGGVLSYGRPAGVRFPRGRLAVVLTLPPLLTVATVAIIVMSAGDSDPFSPDALRLSDSMTAKNVRDLGSIGNKVEKLGNKLSVSLGALEFEPGLRLCLTAYG